MYEIFFTILILFSLVISVYAQDIIITKDSKRIESKITEVTDREIKYKKWTYQDGPLITILKKNIAAIIWATGEVEAFNIEDDSVENKREEISNNIPDKSEDIITHHSELPYLSKNGSLYVASDGQTYNEDELKLYLQKNCVEAYDIWNKGKMTREAGWTLFTCGLTLDFVSTIYSLIPRYNSNSWVIACGIVGGLCELACIPTLIVGYQKKGKAIKCYNNTCVNKNNNISMNVGITNNQIGFIIHF